MAAPRIQDDDKEAVVSSRVSSVHTAVGTSPCRHLDLLIFADNDAEQPEHDLSAKNVKRTKPRAFRTDIYDNKKDMIIDFLAMCILLPPIRGNQ